MIKLRTQLFLNCNYSINLYHRTPKVLPALWCICTQPIKIKCFTKCINFLGKILFTFFHFKIVTVMSVFVAERQTQKNKNIKNFVENFGFYLICASDNSPSLSPGNTTHGRECTTNWYLMKGHS